MAAPLVLHVLPVDLARGAQVYARALRDALDGRDQRHRTATLFAGPPAALGPDFPLGVPAGLPRRAGFDPRAWTRLRHLIHRERPAIVVAHGSEPLKYAVAAAPRGTPVVYYRIGIATNAGRRGARAMLLRALCRRCAAVAGVSNEVLDEARRSFGVAPSACHLIPNGRDPGIFYPGQRVERDRTRLLFVGHMTESKRPQRFIEVLAALRGRGVDVDARMVGDGPLLETVRRTAAAAGVDVLGGRSDVPSQLRDADILLFTSVPEGEGMPGVFVEAGLSGLPIVATDVPGARTVIEDGVTGFVVPVDDTGALVDRIAQLARDAALRRRMGDRAVERCRQHFTLDQSFDGWRALLASLGVPADMPRAGAA
jgi:glycosyltransferase involved in cell wall biosynthesis